jgi:hypothetical protein
MTLKQSQPDVNRDTSSMFQKFQDGALLFESGSKVPQVRLTIFSRVIAYYYLFAPLIFLYFFSDKTLYCYK